MTAVVLRCSGLDDTRLKHPEITECHLGTLGDVKTNNNFGKSLCCWKQTVDYVVMIKKTARW